MTMKNLLSELKQQLAQIAELIQDKQEVFYFDYPLHLNVGDLLIYAGVEQFFQDYQIRIGLRRCWQTFDLNEVKRKITPNTTILCHGGGNFGDLYPALQQMRESLVQAFPHNPIILLPQTGFFSNPQTLLRSAKLFKQHPRCYLFARDQASFELMQQFSDKVYLCPDMAHQLYGLLPQRERLAKRAGENQKILYFLRKDIEASAIEQQIQQHLTFAAEVKDWQDILRKRDHHLEKIYSKLAKLMNKLHFSWGKDWLNRVWYAYALRIIQRCESIFSQYDLIITSRLHGHIFASLLGIPNQVCDNAYGKNLSYYRQWTQDLSYTQPYEN